MSLNYFIHINRLREYAFHGVLPQERITGTTFYITLEAEISVQKYAYESDLLQGTINYDHILKCIHELMQEPVNTLEHLTYKTSQKLLNDFPTIKSLNLLIEKENPPTQFPCKEIGVKIQITR
jgi:dihydroneopterin aldolase